MNLRKRLGYNLSLLAILGVGFMTIYFSSDRGVQMLSLVLTAFFYILWGIIHHYIHHDLTAKIVVEYVLMGTLGISLIFFVLKGGLGF